MHSANPNSHQIKSSMLCIVLSFNGVDDTLHCLGSIFEQSEPKFDVLVVDNGSEPGTTQKLLDEFPSVEIVSLSENHGWAGGNNVGIKLGLERGYDWICLLNNDLVFPDSAVKRWLSAVDNLPPCLLHPTIYYWDEQGIAQLDPGKDGQPVSSAPSLSGKTALDYAYGACLGVHRSIFEKVGLFDERFFLQLEETDFYLRAVKAGFRAVCATDVKIFHKESRAFGGTMAPIKTYYATRNRMLLISKTQSHLAAKFRHWKALYWTISHVADSTEEGRPLSRIAFVFWLFSASPSATAVRFGLRDYFSSRFGRIAPARHAEIKALEKKLANGRTEKA